MSPRKLAYVVAAALAALAAPFEAPAFAETVALVDGTIHPVTGPTILKGTVVVKD